MKYLTFLKIIILIFLINNLFFGTLYKFEENYYYINLNFSNALYLILYALNYILLIIMIFLKLDQLRLNKYKYLFNLLILFLIYLFINDIVVNNFTLSNIKNFSIFIIFSIVVILYKDYSIALKNYIENLLVFIYFIYILLYIVYMLNNTDIGFRLSRPAILLGNANEDGGFLSVLFVFILFKKNFSFLFKIFIIIIHFYILILLNGTRTSIISSMLVTLIFIYYNFYKYYKKSFLVLYLMISTIILVISMYIINNLYLEKTSIIFEKALEDDTFLGRLNGIWIPSLLHLFKTSPLFGFGNNTDLSSITYSYYNDELIFYHRSFHNFFISFIYKWGLIGFLLLLLIIKECFTLSKLYSRDIKNNLINDILSLNASLISFTLWSLIANSFSIMGWLTICFLIIIFISNIETQNKHSCS